MNAFELAKTAFCKPPKTFNSIDVRGVANKFVFPMIDSKVFLISKINQAIISSPFI